MGCHMTEHPHHRYMKANEEAWNEVTPIHKSHRKGEVDFFRSGGITLDKIELKHLGDIKGKKIAHLCCNCGQDTLSLSNMGGECTGFDLSEKALEEARTLASDSGISAEFVHSNVLDIPHEFDSKFDLVYISRGALVWIPDHKLLMKNISRILKKGGIAFIHDQHPFVHLFDDDGLVITHDYFNTEPEEFKGLDYIGNSTYEALPNYQYMVRLSDLITGLAENGMKISKFIEHDRTFFKQFENLVEDEDGFFSFPEGSGKPKFPWMMTLVAVKQ